MHLVQHLTMQRANNSMSLDAMQKIINSFRQVERKIDRLQDDFVTQSKTLHELRLMVGTLNTGFQSPSKEEEPRKHEKRELSHGSLKRRVIHSPKVNKAKSYEPVVPRTTVGTKRSLKVKKAEALKKSSGRPRSPRKNADLETGIRGRRLKH